MLLGMIEAKKGGDTSIKLHLMSPACPKSEQSKHVVLASFD